MTQPIIKSIETNKQLIDTNTNDIQQIKVDISDIRLGVAIKDEHSNVKYTGYTDWRLKLEIYSNIDSENSNVLKPDLLLYNTNTLTYVDYIHLLADSKEIIDTNTIKFINYYNLTSDNLLKRNYQSDTYQDYIINRTNDRLLLRFTLNMLLKESIDEIDFIGENNLPDYSYFINYDYKGTSQTPIYNNFVKGWNTIDWFFIYDKRYYDNTRITLGFNPLVNPNFENKIELITGFLAYNPTSTLNKTKSINYTIASINDPDNEYVIKQEYTPIDEYTLTKTFIFNFSNIDDNNFTSNIILNTERTIKFNSITITNNENEVLEVNNLKLIIDNNNINFIHNQLIKDSYTFTSNINIDNININININFDTLNTSLDYNISLEFYLEVREISNSSNLVFTNNIQETDFTNNKIIFMKDGSIGIGTDNSQNYSLYVNNINSSKKGIYCADDITILSDARFKTNIKTIENPIEKLMALRGVSYNRIDRDINENRFGFIAQEVQKVLPEACDGDKGIKTTDIVALLVEGFKELAKNVK